MLHIPTLENDVAFGNVFAIANCVLGPIKFSHSIMVTVLLEPIVSLRVVDEIQHSDIAAMLVIVATAPALLAMGWFCSIILLHNSCSCPGALLSRI